MTPIRYSIIIPAYNEEERLPPYLDSIVAYFHGQNLTYDITVVDDGSADATSAVITRYCEKNPNVSLIRLPQNRGKGFAVKTGMLKAQGMLRLLADADGATPIAELESLQWAIDNGADVAIGSRALHDDRCYIEARLHRRIIGSIFNTLVRIIAVRGIHDTQCGFKLFTAESAAAIFPFQRIDRFGFDVEILFIGKRLGLEIAEIPVNWTDIKGTKVKLIRDSVTMFLEVLKIRANCARGLYR